MSICNNNKDLHIGSQQLSCLDTCEVGDGGVSYNPWVVAAVVGRAVSWVLSSFVGTFGALEETYHSNRSNHPFDVQSQGFSSRSNFPFLYTFLPYCKCCLLHRQSRWKKLL